MQRRLIVVILLSLLLDIDLDQVPYHGAQLADDLLLPLLLVAKHQVVMCTSDMHLLIYLLLHLLDLLSVLSVA